MGRRDGTKEEDVHRGLSPPSPAVKFPLPSPPTVPPPITFRPHHSVISHPSLNFPLPSFLFSLPLALSFSLYPRTHPSKITLTPQQPAAGGRAVVLGPKLAATRLLRSLARAGPRVLSGAWSVEYLGHFSMLHYRAADIFGS